MKQIIRRLARVGDSSQCRSANTNGKNSGLRQSHVREVPEGHVPVYVGEEMERFVVRTELLSRPVFLELLRRSAHEYGYEQRGVLRIPCTVRVFSTVLDSLLSGDGAHSDADLIRYIDCDA
ncbi:SAUR-like auxin-responsive protein family [Rhynchospora pubera]|uniref:SAUR-like auxin-responsive protein family n=1 Tax=Rhynchospora pubera TaxID=906938 RepID=A0AAV8F2Y6_9POAL|nr:SAUR-like auxin-responsive protein family [Rhynchospora pubera]KAJ4788015.1 SAUR-like auxin-responsive protein family [Rhynchospora pubera]